MSTGRAAGILLVAPTGRVLLLRRSKDGSWGLPGGRVEPDDESPAYAALRELLEETGYDGEVELECASLDVLRTPTGLTYWSFGGKVDREFPVTVNHEHTASGWFREGELPAPLHPGVRQLFARLALG